MLKKKLSVLLVLALAGSLGWGSSQDRPNSPRADQSKDPARSREARVERMRMQRNLPAMRQAAAMRFKQMRARIIGQALAKAKREAPPAGIPELGPLGAPYIYWPFVAPESGPFIGLPEPGIDPAQQILAPPIPDPAGIPHYFGPYANYANSPMPRGAIASLQLIAGGIGYVGPAAVIQDAFNTGSGATASVAATGGVITGITLTSPGANYTAPVVYIVDTAGPGTGADALAAIGPPFTGGLRKFVDAMPGLNTPGANNLNQYIPVAIPDKTTYPGSDYYEIELGQYSERLHSDLQPTLLRGYRQTNTTDPNVSAFHYLGPLIVATQHTPVRIKFTNNLPTGAGGNLFVPVDTTIMGAGAAPNGTENFTQNRAELHLHGGDTPWISDGTPYQWTAPAGETTSYPHGVSVYNVPDMPDAGVGRNPNPGVLTYYYPNGQTARLMFYHDHAVGITRLNVYAGEAAGYLLTDAVEADLIGGTNTTGVNPNNTVLLPDVGIPLVIQDKTFVDPATIYSQDPTWAWGSTPGTPVLGDLWMPHVYMPNQNIADITGTNAFGRWHYGPWFWPPTTNIAHGPTANPYFSPLNAPWEPPLMPATPNPSMAQESFMDTMMVNGTVFPYINVEPKLYRFRILSAGNDRHLNLQMYVADPAVITADGRTNTEVKMVPAAPTPGFPATWPTDGRGGGAPDPATAGPSWIQIATEGGWLPAPVVIPNQPITYNGNVQAFNWGNVQDHSLLLGPAERADVLVDFSAFAGQTLILYNDAPAAFPATDPRYDIYTGLVDQVSTGGPPLVQPGFAPNTRTVMQIRVGTTTSGPVVPLNLTELNNVFRKTASKPGVFESTQPPVIVPEARYNSAYNSVFPVDQFVRIFDFSKTFSTLAGTVLTIPFQMKAIHDEMGAAFDTEYGRMSALLGIELGANQGQQQLVLYPYGSPPVDIIKAEPVPGIPVANDGTQIWRITHNGVDTHTLHWHAYNVQVINRVDWSNIVGLVDANELGWKETVRVNPLEDTIVALRPVVPNVPWELPGSVRPIDLSKPLGAVLPGGPFGFKDPLGNNVTIINHDVNWGWEYVFHCHLLGHEEMDMMHGQILAVPPWAPTGLTGTRSPSGTSVDLIWTDNSIAETGYTVQKASDGGFANILAEFSFGPNVTNYVDTGLNPNTNYFYRVVADNTVGDIGTLGFPVVKVSSTPSNVVGVGPGGVVALAVTSPNGGESWVTGSNHNVTWIQTGLSGLASIDLYKGGVLVRNLGTADIATGAFSWTLAPIEAAGIDYRVRVSQGGALDESDADFTIVRAVVRTDFNVDGQGDILWRNYGTGVYQGLNIVWLMNQTGIPAPQKLGTAQAVKTSASIIAGPASGAQKVTVPKGSFKSALAGGTAALRKPKLAVREPLNIGREGRGVDIQRLGIIARKDAAAAPAPKGGQVEIAALAFSQEVMLPGVADTTWEIVGTGDFNGDRNPDIVWRNYGTGPYKGLNVIWYMNGTQFVSETIFSHVLDTAWKIVGIADFTGDLKPDILWRYNGPGANQGMSVLWAMNGAAFASETVVSQVTDTTWEIVGTGDFNGDRQTDILWRNTGTGPYQGLNLIWYMNGPTFVSEAVQSQVLDTNWQIAGVGDFDKDLDPDILWRYYGGGAYQGLNVLWYLNGATFVSEEVFSAVTDTTWRIQNH